MKKILLSIFAIMLAVTGVQAQNYIKVTSAPDDWSGDYLIVYEAGNVAFNGELTKLDVAKNTVTVTIAGDKILATDDINKAKFTIAKNEDNYTIKSASGFYIGQTSNANGLKSDNTQKYDNTLSMNNDGSVNIVSGSAYLRYNATSGQERFRYYKLNSYTNQEAIALYKYTEASGEGGTTPDTPVIVAPAAPTLPANCYFDNEMTVEITDIAEGATVYYTTDGTVPSETNGETYKDPFKITETTTVKAVAMNEAGSSEVVSATYTKNEPLAEGWIIDKLTRETTGVTDKNYTDWSGKKAASEAVYAGLSAGGNESIQLRSSDSNSGIVTTQSGGKAKKIVVEWNSATKEDRTLNVYGNNTPYSATTDLYNESLQGTLIGTIVKDTSTELVVEGDYEYIGMRSESGAMYLTSVSITWDASAGVTVVPNTPVLSEATTFIGSMNIEITNFADYTNGETIYYSTNDSDFKQYTSKFEITDNAVVVAYAEKGGIKSAEVSKEYTRVAEDPTIAFEGDATAFEGEIVVTVSTESNTPIYYTLNGKTPNANSTLYEAPITIKANATLKAIAIEEGGYKSEVISQKFAMATSSNTESNTTATLIEDVADLSVGDKIVIVAKDYDYALSTTQNKNNRGQIEITKEGSNVTLNDNVQIITLEDGNIENTFAFNVGNGYLYAASSSSNHLKTEDKLSDNSSWIITIADGGVATIKAQGSNTHNWLKYNNSNSLFSCYASGQQEVSIYKVNIASVEDYTLNVTETGWATLYLEYNTTIPTGVTCYTISEVKTDKVTLTEITDVLPANTGVIVKANKGEYSFAPTTENAEMTSNMTGATNNTYITEEAYVLGSVDGEVGLYKAEMAGGVWLNNANKAYLPASAVPSAAQGSNSLRFDFGGTTAVEEVETESENADVIYDLQGRRVNEITEAGIYIINGIKVLIK